MTESVPTEIKNISPRQLWLGVLASVVIALVLLFVVVLPAEKGIDPTGAGRLLGLNALSNPVRTIEIVDIVGGNEEYRNVEIPDFGDPVPLPNPNVYQGEAEVFQSESRQILLGPFEETEIKMVLAQGKMILYSWEVDRGDIYVDFHGHEPGVNDYWVRYQEQQEGVGGNGSLVAPFEGQHGWYWLNYNEFPVVITLNISGYYSGIIDLSANF